MPFHISQEIYPFAGKYFPLGNLQYHYLDEGSGEPIVMVHGNPSWSIYYRNLVKGLRSSYRCIVPDHIGCGFSDKPDDLSYRYTLQQRIDDLERLIESLHLNNITLVVHDWGGFIGMGYAVRHPDKIKRIVVLNTGAFHLPQTKQLPLVLKFCRDSSLATFLIRGFNAFAIGTTWIGCTRKPMSRAIRQAFCAPYNSWANRIAISRFVQDIPLQSGDPSYATLTQIQNRLQLLQAVPMLICWGEQDFVFDRHFLQEWCQRFPAAYVHKFSYGGHYVLEDAADEILKLVQEFLQAHG